MTKKHYHHHIGADTGEPGTDPTVIEIGEPYPEELDPGVDPELDEFNRIKGRVAEAAVALRRAKTGEQYADAFREFWAALDEYEKMAPSEAGGE